MEGSTFRSVAAAARSVLRIKKDKRAVDGPKCAESGARGVSSGADRWEVLFGVVLKALSRFPEAYAVVTCAGKEMEAGP